MVREVGAPTPPGWYPDPWQPGGRRWWDGTGWTAQAGPMFLPPPPIDATKRVADAVGMSRWARVAMWAWPLCTTVGVAVSVVVFRDLIDDLDEQLDEIRAGGEPEAFSGGFSAVSTAISGAQLAALVVIGLWIMRSAEVGKALGRPADRSPGWGIGGFFVPIVNFWFPYASLVQSLAPTTSRGPVLAWWLTFLLNQFSFLIGLPLAIIGVPIPVLLVLSLVLAVITGVLGSRAIDVVTADHEAAVPARAGSAAAPPVV